MLINLCVPPRFVSEGNAVSLLSIGNRTHVGRLVHGELNHVVVLPKLLKRPNVVMYRLGFCSRLKPRSLCRCLLAKIGKPKRQIVDGDLIDA